MKIYELKEEDPEVFSLITITSSLSSPTKTLLLSPLEMYHNYHCTKSIQDQMELKMFLKIRGSTLLIKERRMKTTLRTFFTCQICKNPHVRHNMVSVRLWGYRCFPNRYSLPMTEGLQNSIKIHLEAIWQYLAKLQTHFTLNSAIPFLGMYSINNSTYKITYVQYSLQHG